MTTSKASHWLGLMIGNSRLHWAEFRDDKMVATWEQEHLTTSAAINQAFSTKPAITIYLASVVPQQTALWQNIPQVKVITLAHIPLGNIYPTLGIDRALALWGASQSLGLPLLVIDAGTALTLTGAEQNFRLVGGAILPGLGLQLKTLGERTANLPNIELPATLPQRWELGTPKSIASGVIYTILAGLHGFITNWWQQFPHSQVAITGGDASTIMHYLQAQFPDLATRIKIEPEIIFTGIKLAKQSKL